MSRYFSSGSLIPFLLWIVLCLFNVPAMAVQTTPNPVAPGEVASHEGRVGSSCKILPGSVPTQLGGTATFVSSNEESFFTTTTYRYEYTVPLGTPDATLTDSVTVEDECADVVSETFTINVQTPSDSTPPTTVNTVEFYHAGKDHYFNTANPDDIAYLEANSQSGWFKTGYTFQVYSLNAAPSGTVAVARYYGAQQPDGAYKPDSHFYTALDGERQLLNDGYQKTCPQGQGSCTGEAWFYEKDEYRVFLPGNGSCPTGTYPVYRFYNNGYPAKDSNHRYTADTGAAAEMRAKGWQDEGVKMCAQTPGAPPTCTYAVSQTSINFPAGGGTGQTNVSTQTGCTWTATSNDSWITTTGGSNGTDSGVVTFSISANTSNATRIGTLTIANQSVNISQEAGEGECTYDLSPTSKDFAVDGGPGQANVSTQTGCAWTATSNDRWITIDSGSSGTGSDTVKFTVSVLANASGAVRYGSLTIAGITFTVSQGAPPACTYTVSPTSNKFPAGGGTGQTSVSTQTGCAWTATSNDRWIAITGGSGGTGPGTVKFAVSTNSSYAARSGTLTIAKQTVTISQATGGGGGGGEGGQ